MSTRQRQNVRWREEWKCCTANDVLKDQIVLAYISFTMKENLRMLNGFTRDNWLTSHRQLSVLPNVLIFGHGFRHYCCCLIMLIKCIQPTWTWFQSPSSVIFTLHKINMILFSLLAVCFLSAVISCLHCWRNYDAVKGEVTPGQQARRSMIFSIARQRKKRSISWTSKSIDRQGFCFMQRWGKSGRSYFLNFSEIFLHIIP